MSKEVQQKNSARDIYQEDHTAPSAIGVPGGKVIGMSEADHERAVEANNGANQRQQFVTSTIPVGMAQWMRFVVRGFAVGLVLLLIFAFAVKALGLE